MKGLVVASMIRNGLSYLPRYFDQMNRLRESFEQMSTLLERPMSLQVILVEGDSTDGTDVSMHIWKRRECWGSRMTLAHKNHGGPAYSDGLNSPSVDDEQRWRQISLVANYTLDLAQPFLTHSLGTTASGGGAPNNLPLLWIEADLEWQPETILHLMDVLEHQSQNRMTVLSPLSLHGTTNQFYDTWGYRLLDGRRFTPEPPYVPNLHPKPTSSTLHEIGSAGSCLLIRNTQARVARFATPEMGIVGYCRDLIAHKGRLWIDTSASVRHP